jgi:superfamily II DNA or RNA helicase
MESPSLMPELSSPQDPRGWEPPQALNHGQLLFYKLLHTTSKTRYAIQLPTGYGKSWCACIAHAVLREQGRINRTLIIVPSGTQYDQYVGTATMPGITKDLQDLGIACTGIEWCDGKTRAIKSHRQNTADIFIATVQKIVSDPGFFADLLGAGGHWLLIADEHHHYATNNTWGRAIQALPHVVMLGMSATPIRADRQYTVLNGASDIVISVEEALHEHAIRPIQAHISNYFVDLISGEMDVPTRFTLDRLAEEAGTLDFSEWEARKKIRYHSIYLAQILTEALTLLAAKNAREPQQHQMLVFVMSCKHAAHVAEVLNVTTQDPQFAQWIGEGPNGKDPQVNRTILDAYYANTFRCLVQVNKAGEGFNNVRCSVGVFLNLIGDTPMARQQLGRFLRRNRALPWQGDCADIFASCDARIVPLLELYEEATQIDEEERHLFDDDFPGDESRATRLARIPDLFIVDVEFIATTLRYPFGSLQASVDALRPQVMDQMGLYASAIQIEQALIKILAAEQRPALASPIARQEAVQTSVNDAVTTLAVNALKCLYRGDLATATIGKARHVIHRQWIRESNMAHEDMNEAEYRAKYAWVQALNDRICHTREVPEWLHI